MTAKMSDEYLGDGVYASFDGFGITLDLRAQEPTVPITTIVLDPEVYQALVNYHARCVQWCEDNPPPKG